MSDLIKNEEFNTKLDAWHNARQQAEYWKNQEAMLRVAIFGEAFPKPEIGTNKVRIAHDMALIGDHRINYRIDQPGLEATRPEIPAALFDSVISYSPKVKDGAYRKLSPADLAIFAHFITETPGTPGLEIKPASKVRW